MAVDVNNVVAMSNGIASVAPALTAVPADLRALSSPWVDLGAISTAGLTENLAETRSDFKRWGSISPFMSVITDEKRSWDISFLETKADTMSLYYKTPALTSSATGTSDVQTVTISGSPTGGTFTLTFAGQTTAAIAYNATAAVVQAALAALSNVGSGDVTVTGSAGGPWTVTFVGALGNSPQPAMTGAGSFTGGTSPAVAVVHTTTGTSGNLIAFNDDLTGVLDPRAFVFDVLQGTNHFRFCLPNAQVTARKNPVYKTDTITEYGVTVTAYPDLNGISVKRLFLLNAVVNNL